MDRRQFLISAAGSGMLLGGCGRLGAGDAVRGGAPLAGRPIAGMSPRALREKYRRELFEVWLPFMDAHVIDHESGGFMCDCKPDGVRTSDNKDTRYIGRGAWTWAYLNNHIQHDPHFIEVARKSADFGLKLVPADRNKFVPRFVDRQGAPQKGTLYTDLFTDLFLAEGCQEVWAATGEEKYWGGAIDLLMNFMRLYDSPNFTSRDTPYAGTRHQSIWFVLLITTSQMLRRRRDARLEEIAARCVDAIINYHYNPDFGLNNEIINHDMSRPSDPKLARASYVGHGIEGLWMVMEEAERRRDDELFRLAAARFRHHVEAAWDGVYGGVYVDLSNVDENRYQLIKNLWTQEEVLIGTLMIYERTGDPWALDMFSRMHRFVFEKFPVSTSPGGAYWLNTGTRRVEKDKENMPETFRAENYHHPRHFMRCIQVLDKIIDEHTSTNTLLDLSEPMS